MQETPDPQAAELVLREGQRGICEVPGEVLIVPLDGLRGVCMSSSMDVIAERQLEFVENGSEGGCAGTITVCVGKPELEQGGPPWRVLLEIRGPGPGEVRRATAYGEDSLQALILAMRLLPVELASYERRGRLTQYGAPHDLGFSVPEPDSKPFDIGEWKSEADDD